MSDVLAQRQECEIRRLGLEFLRRQDDPFGFLDNYGPYIVISGRLAGIGASCHDALLFTNACSGSKLLVVDLRQVQGRGYLVIEPGSLIIGGVDDFLFDLSPSPACVRVLRLPATFFMLSIVRNDH